MSIIKIAGIDPGLRNTGYGIVNYDDENEKFCVEYCGYVDIKYNQKGLEAILSMSENIAKLSHNKFFDSVDKIVVEVPKIAYSRCVSASSMIPVGVICGCILSRFNKDKIIPVYPSTWNKCKRKIQTQELVQDELGNCKDWGYHVKPKSESKFEHIIDAVGMASWYLKSNFLGYNNED